MTLVLTELSEVGIAMAADSAMAMLEGDKIKKRNQDQWCKLLHVPSITAAISYWGWVGKVTTKQFDLWLKGVIQAEKYHDLASFADCLADALNEACHWKPLADGYEVGIHVAGYAPWPDGERRPVFYHVHNGHGTILTKHTYDDSSGKPVLVRVDPEWVSDPRKLFEKHQDFPKCSATLDENLAILRAGYITRNGDYFLYAVISRQLEQAIQYINRIPNVSIPRDPTSLLSRKGYLYTMLDFMVNLYRCSSKGELVGGTVKSLAIGPEGYR